MTSPDVEFWKYDADGDGLLDKAELQTCLSISIPVGTSRPFSMKCIEYFLSNFGSIIPAKGYCIDLHSFSRLVQYVDEMIKKFRRFDHRQSGKISCADMCQVFGECGLACDEATMQKIGTKYDTDGNGTLEFDEFCQFLIEWEFYGNVFRAVDKDNSGSISACELASMLSEMQANFGETAWVEQWAVPQREFSHRTVFALLMKFGGDYPTPLPELDFTRFGQLLTYLGDIKNRFSLHSILDKKIMAADLQAAFRNMGLNASEKFISKIVEFYDEDRNGTLEFDEFCRLIIDWDQYVEIFRMCVSGSEVSGVTPLVLQKALSILPMAYVSAVHPGTLQAGRNLILTTNTCNLLVSHFSATKTSLALLEFCEVLEVVKGLKQQFHDFDVQKGSSPGYVQLPAAFTLSGLRLSEASLISIMSNYDGEWRYDDDKPVLSFDAFVHLRMELAVYKTSFDTFSTNGMLNLNFDNMVDFIYQIPRTQGDAQGRDARMRD
eukprot:GEMP01008358.1.p1 GENE.GEMP01008358.1~~GEMP01008358.1.p1  ORF type:complete len:492 (+),score=93.78 GEMP01008358.1:134-1609(+)